MTHDEPKEQYNVHLPPGTTELTVFHSTKVQPREPKETAVTGVISAPWDYYNHHFEENNLGDKENIVVTYSESAKIITLTYPEHEPYQDVIHGVLKANPDLNVFKINTGHVWTHTKLRDLIRFNRVFFADKEHAGEILKVMMDFKAKADTEMAHKDDQRGTSAARMSVNIEIERLSKELGLEFKLRMPLFAGQEPTEFLVEMQPVLEDNIVHLVLESPEMKQYEREQNSSLIGIEISKFKEKGICVMQID